MAARRFAATSRRSRRARGRRVFFGVRSALVSPRLAVPHARARRVTCVIARGEDVWRDSGACSWRGSEDRSILSVSAGEGPSVPPESTRPPTRSLGACAALHRLGSGWTGHRVALRKRQRGRSSSRRRSRTRREGLSQGPASTRPTLFAAEVNRIRSHRSCPCRASTRPPISAAEVYRIVDRAVCWSISSTRLPLFAAGVAAAAAGLRAVTWLQRGRRSSRQRSTESWTAPCAGRSLQRGRRSSRRRSLKHERKRLIVHLLQRGRRSSRRRTIEAKGAYHGWRLEKTRRT